jgi:hypothetical protein
MFNSVPPRPVKVGFVMDSMAVGQTFLLYDFDFYLLMLFIQWCILVFHSSINVGV